MIYVVKTQYWRHKARLGAPSLVHDIRDKGYPVSERTVSRALQTLGLRSKTALKFKYKMDVGVSHQAVPNTLVRQFNPDKPNIAWVVDITYIKTGEGWLYLYVIIDLYGRQVIGRQTSRYIDRYLVCNALKQALFEYIEIYYNRVRRHSANGWISPEQYEKQYYQNNKIIAVSTV